VVFLLYFLLPAIQTQIEAGKSMQMFKFASPIRFGRSHINAANVLPPDPNVINYCSLSPINYLCGSKIFKITGMQSEKFKDAGCMASCSHGILTPLYDIGTLLTLVTSFLLITVVLEGIQRRKFLAEDRGWLVPSPRTFPHSYSREKITHTRMQFFFERVSHFVYPQLV